MPHVCILASLKVGDELRTIKVESDDFDGAIIQAARGILALNASDFTPKAWGTPGTTVTLERHKPVALPIVGTAK